MKQPLALALAAALAACSSTWESGEPVQPSSYAERADAVPRYAGKLRRLVLLPTFYEPVASECSPQPVGELARALDAEARAFLVDWKGYVVLEAGDALPGDARAALARDVGRWQVREPEARMPPPQSREQLRQFAAARGADGVVVMYAAPECIGVVDITLNLLAIGMPNFYGKALGRNFSGGLYEAGTGALVWQRRVSIGGRNEGLPQEGVQGAIESLFGLLENAIPEILLR